MDILIVVALVLAVVGIVGCCLPVIPGPPLSWVALLCLYYSDSVKDPVSTTTLVICGVFALVLTVMDYVLPGKLTKLSGGHKSAERGATIGLFVGLIFTPIGMLLGSFLGAFLGEFLFHEKQFVPSLKAAVGSFVAFILTTGLKALFSVIVLWSMVVHLI